ncbi:complex I NDUFA9 subunit family protein [Segnochrobactrum spirostomi]|uniref:Complex I NDUFA9 subunit family protein n=1 Tax=Segnochrobactrum spirostomi TaxID=2608987 RepID=A0A6A7Y4M2_9HYPH|nr:complex I NDUFA9 subunit family protein [Segnochrobactrum spirostomi]MQT13317.1 complex I NDUFA9 subunit family protein [Segnochrobactrum spirostomi]
MAEALKEQVVTIFGGSGFIGRHVVRALAHRGYRVRPAVRRPDLAGYLQTLGMAGQVLPVQANLRYRWSVDRAVEGASAVVNLVGILAEGGRQSFEAVQAFGARAVAEATRGAGIGTFVHVSAIGADANSPSSYARTKAKGEAAVREVVPEAVIMRPSLVFGPEDGFFNLFGSLARSLPFLPVIGGDTKAQPVFVGDVATAIADAVEAGIRRTAHFSDPSPVKAGTTYELGGPEVKTFHELIALVNEQTGRKRPLIGIPAGLAKLQASVLQLLPNPMLTVDQVKLLQHDNVVSAAAAAEGRTLEGLGIAPTSLAAILPTYLTQYRPHGQYDTRLTA